jgi:hypothetical protein
MIVYYLIFNPAYEDGWTEEFDTESEDYIERVLNYLENGHSMQQVDAHIHSVIGPDGIGEEDDDDEFFFEAWIAGYPSDDLALEEAIEYNNYYVN